MGSKGSGKLGDSKGADILGALANRMKSKPASPARPATNRADEDLGEAMRRQDRPAPRTTSLGQAAAAKLKGKKKKVIIKLPRHAIDQAMRDAANAAGSVAPKEEEPRDVSDYGAAAFHRIEKLRNSLELLVSDHRAPAMVSEDTRKSVEAHIALGATTSDVAVDPGAEGYIGYDFGTSATKAVVRWPYVRALGAYAIPTPSDWSSDGLPHLWPTVVFFDRSKKLFKLLPDSDLVPLSGFKSALLEERGHRMCNGAVAMTEAATAFLTLHLAHVIGTIAERNPDAGISEINFGVPVAALADERTRRAFEELARAATSLLPQAEHLTIDAVRDALTSAAKGSLPFELHAELTGDIAGYCAGPRPFMGAHMIIDTGSATLDIASFNLGPGPWPLAVHAAEVHPLGADACATYESVGATAEECGRASRYEEHLVYSQTIRRDPTGFRQGENNLYPYQMIVVGGGIDGPIHKPLFERMEKAFQRPFHRPELDRDLVRDSKSEGGRLILADGLARPSVDLRGVAMPLDRPTEPPSPLPEMITKDQI